MNKSIDVRMEDGKVMSFNNVSDVRIYQPVRDGHLEFDFSNDNLHVEYQYENEKSEETFEEMDVTYRELVQEAMEAKYE